MSASDGERSAPSTRLSALMRRAVLERIPVSGSFALTHRCNLRCFHCYLGDERLGTAGGAGDRDTAFWLDVVDQVAEAGCLNLLITGGEPMQRPDFGAVYERAATSGILVTVFTNATRVTRPVLELFDELPPRLVEVSLYGATEETYERVTGVPGSYRRCLDGVDALLSAGVKVGLKTMLMAETRDEIAEMRRMAEARGASFRLDPSLFPCRDGDTAPLDHRIPPAEAVAIEMQDEAYRRRAGDYYEKKKDLPPGQSLYSCTAGRTNFHVDARGHLFACMMVTSDGFDLARGRFAEGWGGPLARFLDQPAPPGYECHTCERRFICGICPAQFAMENGSPDRKSQYVCRLGEERHGYLAPGALRLPAH